MSRYTRSFAKLWLATWLPGFDLAELNRWILALPDGDAKTRLLRLRASMFSAYRQRDYFRLEERLDHLLTLRQLVGVQHLASQSDAAKRQRLQASASAARERRDEARAAHALVRHLTEMVPARVKERGAAATAREVRKLAASAKPQTIEATKVAAYSDRTLRKLISGD